MGLTGEKSALAGVRGADEDDPWPALQWHGGGGDLGGGISPHLRSRSKVAPSSTYGPVGGLGMD